MPFTNRNNGFTWSSSSEWPPSHTPLRAHYANISIYRKTVYFSRSSISNINKKHTHWQSSRSKHHTSNGNFSNLFAEKYLFSFVLWCLWLWFKSPIWICIINTEKSVQSMNQWWICLLSEVENIYYFLFLRLRPSPISSGWLGAPASCRNLTRRIRTRIWVAFTRRAYTFFAFPHRFCFHVALYCPVFANVKFEIEKGKPKKKEKLLFDFSFRFVWITFLFFLLLWPKMIYIFNIPLGKRFDFRCVLDAGALNERVSVLTKCQIFHKIFAKVEFEESEKQQECGLFILSLPHVFGTTYITFAHWSAWEY